MKRHFKIVVFALAFTVIAFSIGCNKNNQGNDALTGSTWVVTRIDNSGTNSSVVLNDTIEFISRTKYRINGKEYFYSIGLFNGEENYYCNIENYVELGGDIQGYIDPEAIENGAINSTPFTRDFDSTIFYLWLTKLN